MLHIHQIMTEQDNMMNKSIIIITGGKHNGNNKQC